MTFKVSNYSFDSRIQLDVLDGGGRVISAGGGRASAKIQPWSIDGFSYNAEPSIPQGVYYVRLTTGRRRSISYDLTVSLESDSFTVSSED